LLIGKVKEKHAALFYIHETIENGWSRDVLDANGVTSWVTWQWLLVEGGIAKGT